MNVLLVPMLALGQTDGPFSRVRALAKAFSARGCRVAVCIGDRDSSSIPDVQSIPLTMPVPMGLPRCIGLRAYPLADKLGLMGKKTVHSFEEVLHLTGALSYGYLKQSVWELRSVICRFKPDVVYAEFNLSAVIAATAEHVPIVGSYSLPVMPDFASSPQFAGGCNRLLRELGQPPVRSPLELFERLEYRFVPSSFELEPMEGNHARFVGPFGRPNAQIPAEQSRRILVYMGTGGVSTSRLRKTIIGALGGTPYEVYLAGVPEETDVGNIHMARRFPFSQLLPGAAVYIHHGGQNSVMDALLCGVPQLVNPGRIFERRFNATTVEKNGAGLVLGPEEFCASNVLGTVQRLTAEESFRKNAAALGRTLQALGGASAAADQIIAEYGK
jgi:hypothetical protein